MANPQPLELPIAALEIEEFLFSNTAAAFAQDRSPEEARDHIRGSLRMHRFMVFTWLLNNGVNLPLTLLADNTHPPVGQQAPDRPAPPRP